MPRTLQRADLNTIDEDEIARVPEIGPERAHELVERRPIQSWEDIKKFPGFDDTMIEALQNAGLTIEETEEE